MVTSAPGSAPPLESRTMPDTCEPATACAHAGLTVTNAQHTAPMTVTTFNWFTCSSCRSVAATVDVVDVPVPWRRRRRVFHRYLHQRRALRRQRAPQRGAKILGTLDGDALGAEGTCHRR